MKQFLMDLLCSQSAETGTPNVRDNSEQCLFVADVAGTAAVAVAA